MSPSETNVDVKLKIPSSSEGLSKGVGKTISKFFKEEVMLN